MHSKWCYFLIICALSETSFGNDLEFEHQIIDATEIAYQRQIGDLDGDGMNDVAGFAHAPKRDLFWFRAPDFQKQNLLTLSASTHGFEYFRSDGLRLADIDNDGDLDIVVRIGDSGDNNGKVVWIENPNWIVHDVGFNLYTKDIEVADLDQDGLLDIITRQGVQNPALSATQIWFQNTPTNWTLKQINHGPYEGIAVGDIDGDSDLDIVLNGYWLRTPDNPRTGTFTQHIVNSRWFTGQSGQWYQQYSCKVAVADIDNNGTMDVILSHSELTGFPVAWYSTDDPVNGPWEEHIIRSRCDYCHNLQVGDFDLDSRIDVVSGGMIQSDQRGLVLHLNKVDGWNSSVIQNLGSYSAVIGDIDDDFDLDIVTIRQWDQSPTEIWRNLLDPTLQGDVNGDCKVDAADLGIVLLNFGMTDAVLNDGDANGDKEVNISDLGIILNQFGMICSKCHACAPVE